MSNTESEGLHVEENDVPVEIFHALGCNGRVTEVRLGIIIHGSHHVGPRLAVGFS